MAIEKLRVTVQKWKLRLRMQHEKIDWDSIAPIGQNVNVAGHREELHCNQMIQIVIRKTHYHFHRVVGTNDYVLSSISREQTDWNVVNNLGHDFLPLINFRKGLLQKHLLSCYETKTNWGQISFGHSIQSFYPATTVSPPPPAAPAVYPAPSAAIPPTAATVDPAAAAINPICAAVSP